MTTSTSPSSTGHHGLAVHEVVLMLGTNTHRGLTTGEATARRESFGPNTVPAPVGAGLLTPVLRQFRHPLIYVLLRGRRHHCDDRNIRAHFVVGDTPVDLHYRLDE